jgi:cell fate (sporulation/competence/biofilm development) regulator YlbF (YheA/YmcA/DUF963 family)
VRPGEEALTPGAFFYTHSPAPNQIHLRFPHFGPIFLPMQTIPQIEDAVRQKTLELCETIVQQPQFQSIRQRVDSFMADHKAQQQYQSLTEKGRSLHDKQHQGLTLDSREIAAFESERDALLGNPVAKAFIDAQEEMHEMQEDVHKFIHKTFELGRLPAEEDLQEGSCGQGCGCQH